MDNTNAERQKRYRSKQKALRKGSVTGEEVTDSVTVLSLNETDSLFDDAMPGYYIFSDIERTHDKMGEPLQCWKCGKKFTTRLELNRFCSPVCKDNFLRDALHKRD